jgi:SNF2 family DNA or RNA helicase
MNNISERGTLMQNRHDELFYLMNLVRPNLLGDWDSFSNDISKPITYARAKDAHEKVLRRAAQCEQMLRDRIKPAYLERKKEEVLKDSLTKKREKVVFCELTEIQKKIYRHIIALPDYQHLRFANAPCDCGINKQYFRAYKKMRTHKEQLNYQRRHKSELTSKKICCYKYPWNPRRGEPGEPEIDPDAILWIQGHEKPIGNHDDIREDIIDDKYIVCPNCPTCTTLAAMNKLYKIASHPCLLQVDHCETGIQAKRKLEFAKVALTPDVLRELPGGTYWKSDGIMDDHMKLSGKMKTLDYLLRRYLRTRNRVLVFSYSTASLDVIQNHIKVSLCLFQSVSVGRLNLI